MSDDGLALRMERISKRYPGTLAVDEVDFDAEAGEVHALIGENGAGKSTLMKILAGSFADYTGRVLINGREVRLHSPAIARANGVQMIHQELSLAPPLSIAENVLAGRLPARFGFLDRAALLAETRRCLERVGLDLDPLLPVEEISQHEAQLVEIARAVGNNPHILVMDEPTSALSREEVSRLFAIIRKLRQQGLAIVYISHHMPEILEIADRVTIMRDGKKVATKPISGVNAAQLVEMMVGRSISDLYAQRRNPPGAEKLRVERLSRYGFFHDASFAVRAGEILGICGLAGAGRSELARSLCGIDPVDSGALRLNGALLEHGAYQDAIRAGFAYLTEDRKAQGLALRLNVAENALSAVVSRCCTAGLYSQARGAGLLGNLIESLQINPPDPRRTVGNLSGGNQQKVLLGKWLAADPQVLILDEPTRGVDVGAKVVIHKAIAQLADQGRCVILISSDLPELVGLSDRIVVMRKGRLIGQ
ncbi:MAG: sugar ABC transporter ATP-binding protein, partial [Planctomycetota bacterium]|nr:sugar ABC transporter ATP-binding protein [Planctomycetota bacterium]